MRSAVCIRIFLSIALFWAGLGSYPPPLHGISLLAKCRIICAKPGDVGLDESEGVAAIFPILEVVSRDELEVVAVVLGTNLTWMILPW